MGTGREGDWNWKRSRWELEEKGMGTGREVDGNWNWKRRGWELGEK